MKKLMIAAVVAFAGIAVNAAAINWQSSSAVKIAKDAEGTTGTVSANMTDKLVTMYVYELLSDPLEMEGGKTAAEKYAAAQKMDAATLYDNYFNSTKYSAKGTTKGNGIVSAAQTVDAASGKHYAVVLFVDELNANLPEGKDAFVKAAVAVGDVGGSSDINVQNLITSTTSSNWTAVPVPEPTSGLLLLLGVAGMALRRRRA